MIGKNWQLPIICAALLLLTGCDAGSRTASEYVVTGNPVLALSSGNATDPGAGFERAYGPVDLEFPADHGAHNDFQTEWWYYTGNLFTPDGRHFGYQLTFFRRALLPPASRLERASEWFSDQVYMAHFAITDTGGNQQYAFEKFSRGAAGLAGARSLPFSVWLDDWQVSEIGPDTYSLSASFADIRIELVFTDTKGPVRHGEQGYSQKGSTPGNASYYYSLTRLDSSGSIEISNRAYAVSGDSWMDHEFSTSLLSSDQVGWDWVSIQFEEDWELMLFQIRRADGTIDPFSSGSLIDKDGSVITLGVEDFNMMPEGEWRSPRSGAIYPSHWNISLPGYSIVLDLAPVIADQELSVTYAYWEGALRVSGTREGEMLSGYGYLEMTGYQP